MQDSVPDTTPAPPKRLTKCKKLPSTATKQELRVAHDQKMTTKKYNRAMAWKNR